MTQGMENARPIHELTKILTKRELFAAMQLQAIRGRPGSVSGAVETDRKNAVVAAYWAKRAVEWADALIAELAK